MLCGLFLLCMCGLARNVTRKRKKMLACTDAAASTARTARWLLAQVCGTGASKIDRPPICRARPPTRPSRPSRRSLVACASLVNSFLHVFFLHSKLASQQEKAQPQSFIHLYLSCSWPGCLQAGDRKKIRHFSYETYSAL